MVEQAQDGQKPEASDSGEDHEELPSHLFDASVADGLPARLDHPFEGWSTMQVERVARQIAGKYRFQQSRMSEVQEESGESEESWKIDERMAAQEFEELFVKAAKVLKDPDPAAWRDIPGLGPGERKALIDERMASFWDQPWPLQITFLMLFLAAVVQGWSQTGLNGANLRWPQVLIDGVTITDACNALHGRASWIFAAVNAAPFLAASLLGCWVSDPLNELFFGRRPAIGVSACFVFAGAVGSALSERWYQLLACRAILGLGMGCKAAVVPVFAAEIAPAHLRGTLVMNWQVFDAFGIFLGFAANLAVSKTGTPPFEHFEAPYTNMPNGVNSWRWQLASTAIPAFALFWGVVFVCWDSPRFLMKHEEGFQRLYKDRQERWETRMRRIRGMKGWHPHAVLQRRLLRLSQAFKRSIALPYKSPAFETLSLLRGEPILAAKELMFIHCQLLIEMRHSDSANRKPQGNMNLSLASRSGWFTRLGRLWTRVEIFREARAAVAVMLSQQLCGTNILQFYSSSLFCSVGSHELKTAFLIPLALSCGLGFVNFVFAFPAYKWIETHGRRWLLITTLPVLASLLAGAAGSLDIDHHPNIRRDVVAMFTYVFTAIVSFGPGPVPFTYSAEIFPLEQRMVGMSLAVFVNLFFAGLLTLFVPALVSALGYAKTLGLFSGLNIVAWILVWAFVPEIVGPANNNDRSDRTPLNLEQLFKIFRLPMAIHRLYQWKEYNGYVWEWWKSFFGGYEFPDMPEPYFIWGERKRIEREQENSY